MKCYVCGKEGPSKFTEEANAWDWFQGYLPQTVHFCPEHKNSEQREDLHFQALKNPNTKICPTCHGSGEVVAF